MTKPRSGPAYPCTLAGYVDDEIKHQGPAFNDALAQAGYTVDVVAEDGFKATFDSARVARSKDILAAYLVNGNPLPDQYFPLRLVGNDVSKKEQVGAIGEIVVVLDGQPAPLQSQRGAWAGCSAAKPLLRMWR